MAIADITKPMALDETLQGTNGKLDTHNGKMDSVITKLQGIIDALGVDTSVYKAAGNKTCAELVPTLLVASNLGNVYNITDSGTTTSDFVEGSDKPIHIGDNVAIVDVGTGGSNVYKFDLLAGMVDLTNYVQKSSTAGLLKNDGSVDTNTYATTSQVSGKADKVTNATNGNLAGLNGSGNLTDSGVAASEIPALWKSQGEYGVKNLIPFPYKDGMSKTHNGVTFTVNADGSITANSNGVASTGTARFDLATSLVLPAGDYILTGDLDTETTYNATAILFNENTESGASHWNYGKNTPCEFTIASSGGYTIASLRIRISSGVTVNQTFYPMIRVAADSDETYRPYAKTNKQLTDMVDETTKSVSGNPISISGLKANQLAVNPIITLEPIQAGSGTPSPSNIRAISGYDKIEVLSCGKNLCDNSKNRTGGYYRGDGVWVSDQNYVSSELIPVVPNTTYRGHIYNKNTKEAINDIVYVLWSDETTGTGQYTSSTITTGADTKYVTIRNYGSDASYITNNNFLFALELGNTSSTTYPEYNKTTDLSESLGQTVYGATWYIRDGKFIITHGKKRMEGNDTFSGSSIGTNAQLTLSDMKVGRWATDEMTVCDSLPQTTQTSQLGFNPGANNNTVYFYNLNTIDASINSSPTLNAYLTNHPIEFTYPLATPIEIQLTPHEISLLKGYAYVSTNGTSIALDYHNGEIASLADVSQLGETVNNLPKGLIKTKTYTLTPNSNGRITLGAITDMIPFHIRSITNAYYAVLRVATNDNQYYYAKVYNDAGENGTLEGTYIVYGFSI